MAKKLERVADDARVAELTQELQHIEERLPALRERLEAANNAVSHAQEAVDQAEIAVLAGRAGDKQLAEARNALADRKREAAIALHDHADVERYLRVLPAAREEAVHGARVQVAATLRQQYGETLGRLRERLLAAREANAELLRIHQVALDEFPVTDRDLQRFHSAVIDLGSGGLTTSAAGLPFLAFAELGDGTRRMTRLDLWLQEADALLAQLPDMAERDKQHRIRHDSNEARQAEVERKKEANWAAIMKRDMERFGLR